MVTALVEVSTQFIDRRTEMSLSELVNEIVSMLPEASRDLMKPPADDEAILRLQSSMNEWLSPEEVTIHDSFVDLYRICGGEKPRGDDKYSERKLLGVFHRLLTPDNARSWYDELMKERRDILRQHGGEAAPASSWSDDWFSPRCVPFAEFAREAEFLCMGMESGAVLKKNSLGLIFQFDSIEGWLREVIEEYSMG